MQNRAGQCSGAGADLHYAKIGGLSETIKLGIDEAREHGAEQRTNLGRCDEVTAATGTTNLRIETLLAVQRIVEVLVEAQLLAQGAI